MATAVNRIVVLVLFSTAACAAISEEHFQARWTPHINFVVSDVQDHYALESGLPETLDDLDKDGGAWTMRMNNVPVDLSEWTRYRRLEDARYVVWLSRNDLVNLGMNPGSAVPEKLELDALPKDGDVYAYVDAGTGDKVQASW